MQCPKCLKEVKDNQALFCPYCGYEFSTNTAELELKLTPQKQKVYSYFLFGSLILSILSLFALLYAPYPFLYVITAVISWWIIGIISNRIGYVDRLNIPESIVSFLKRMGYVVMFINLINIATIILFVIFLF